MSEEREKILRLLIKMIPQLNKNNSSKTAYCYSLGDQMFSMSSACHVIFETKDNKTKQKYTQWVVGSNKPGQD